MSQTQPLEQRVLVNRKGQELTTTLSDKEAFDFLAKLVDQGEADDFAESLIAKGRKYNSISQEQFWWIHKLGQPKPPPVNLELYQLWCCFDSAMENGVRIKQIRKAFLQDSPEEFILQMCGPRSKHYGSIMVIGPGEYPQNKYYGKILSGSGEFQGRDTPKPIQDMLTLINRNPGAYLPW